MKLTQISSIVITAFLSFAGISSVHAADVAQANAKPQKQRVLSAHEKKLIAAEIERRFKTTDEGSFQKLNNNPWAGKKARQKQHADRMLRLSGSMDSCRQFALKQRNQCYSVGNESSMCEAYYNARLGHCAEYF